MKSDLGANAARIASITSGSWCGQKQCQEVFGGDPGFRLAVTLKDGVTLHCHCGTTFGAPESSPPGESQAPPHEGIRTIRECSRGG